MTAGSEDRYEDVPTGLQGSVLPAVLGFVALVCLFGTVDAVTHLIATKKSWEPWAWQTVRPVAANLLIGAAAIWGLSRLKPSKPKTVALSVLLGFAALLGFSGTISLLKVLFATNTFWGPWAWQTAVLVAWNALIGVGAIVGVSILKPWKGWKRSREPVSPATRRTNKLFGLSALIGIVAPLALIHGTSGKDNPFSNSPISPGIAIVAITAWLLATAVEWWWYFSADEHERKAADFASIVGRGVFTTVTPAWWVAARADLLPQLDAMVLWVIVMGISAIAWLWHRNR
jgi:hypothetical protein